MKDNILNDSLRELLFAEPFFTAILRSIDKVETKSLPTAGVTIRDGSPVLYWNPDFLESLNEKERIGLLKHECYHLIFKHIIKRKHDPHVLWNIATDLAINSIIPFKQLPKGGFIPGKPLQIPKNGIPKDELERRVKLSEFIENLPVNMSSEWYMNELINNEEIADSIKEMMSSSACASADGSGPGTGQPHPGFDVHLDPEGDGNDSSLLNEIINKIVKDAVTNAERSKGWGSVSSEIRKELMTMYSKSVDWKSVLKYFCGTKQRANKSSSFRRINRKYPYIHPGKKKSYTSNIAVYIDQSGSVSDDDIQLLFGNLNELAKRVTFTVYFFDTKVDEKSRFIWTKNKKIPKGKRTRSGGTNFNAVEKYHRKVMREFDGYMVLTDGECFKPDVCKTKRCWILLPGTELYFIPDKRDTVVKMTKK